MRKTKEIIKMKEETLYIANMAHDIKKGKLDNQIVIPGDMLLHELADDISHINSTLNDYVSEISHILSHLSVGDIGVPMSPNIKYQGDFIPIKNALHKIRHSLNDTFESFRDLSLNIDEMCHQLEKDSSSIAQNAAKQADLISDLTNTMFEIADQTSMNAVNAENTSKCANEVMEEAKVGENYMNQMLSSMQSMKVSSKDIYRIIEIIRGIAGQTKLLALNASIEAARAGDSGRGFAVVADQVSLLATQSADAVSQTTELINKSIKNVEESTDLANLTASTFTKINSSIEKTARLSTHIAELSKEQAIKIKGTTGIISDISGFVQNNAACAEENCNGASHLVEISKTLKEILMQFRLRDQKSDYVPNDQEKENSIVLINKLTSRLSCVDSEAKIDEVLTEEIRNSTDVECFYVIKQDGVQISHTIMNPHLPISNNEDFMPALPGDEHVNKKYFIQAIKYPGQVYISFEYISAATGGLCKTVSYSYKAKDGTLYVLCIDNICRY